MLTPAIASRIDRLVAAYAKGVFSAAEAGMQLGYLITTDNLPEVLQKLPAEMLTSVKAGIEFDNKQVADRECLYPESSVFDTAPDITRYYHALASQLLERSIPRRQARISVICQPSFEPEWALQLFEMRQSKFVFMLKKAIEQIWAREPALPLSVQRFEMRVSPQLAVGISNVWQGMLSRVRWPKLALVPVDGVEYHFACNIRGTARMSGLTWSPTEATAPGKLVALSELLCRYVESGNPESVEMLGEIQQAVDWFQAFFT